MSLKKLFQTFYIKAISILTILAVLGLFSLALLVGIKQFYISYPEITEITHFQKITDEGEIHEVTISPDFDVLFAKQYKDKIEVALYKYNCFEAKHYLLGIYCLGNFPFGLRYYHNAEYVLEGEMKMIARFGESFPKVGEAFNDKIIIFKDRGIIGSEEYVRVPHPDSLKQEFYSIITKIKSGSLDDRQIK